MASTRSNTHCTRNISDSEATSHVEEISETRVQESSDVQQAFSVNMLIIQQASTLSSINEQQEFSVLNKNSSDSFLAEESSNTMKYIHLKKQLRDLQHQCNILLQDFNELSSDMTQQVSIAQADIQNAQITQSNHDQSATSMNLNFKNIMSILDANLNMKNHLIQKNIEKFKNQSMKEFETFVTVITVFHISDLTYFNKHDHRKIIEAVTHFKSEMQ
ncbi:hypothetical protein ACJ72_08626, partial [Emergomyces africanus]